MMKVLDIIKNLVRKDENRSHEDHLSELVPIDLVFRGYGFWGGKRRPFKFDPHPDYKKKKPYEKIIDTDDNDKRCKGLSSINEDIGVVSFTPGTVVCLERDGNDIWSVAWMVRPELLKSLN